MEDEPLDVRLGRLESDPLSDRGFRRDDLGGRRGTSFRNEAVEFEDFVPEAASQALPGEAQQIPQRRDPEPLQSGQGSFRQPEADEQRFESGVSLLGGAFEDLESESRPRRRKGPEPGEAHGDRSAKPVRRKVLPERLGPLGKRAEEAGEAGSAKPERSGGAAAGPPFCLSFCRPFQVGAPAPEALRQPTSFRLRFRGADMAGPERGAGGDRRDLPHSGTDAERDRPAVGPANPRLGLLVADRRHRILAPFGVAPEQDLQRQRRDVNTCQPVHDIPSRSGIRGAGSWGRRPSSFR